MNRFFFFFQAEDGIRDKLVTGVQTCALPISTCALLLVAVGRGAPNAAVLCRHAAEDRAVAVANGIGGARNAAEFGDEIGRQTDTCQRTRSEGRQLQVSYVNARQIWPIAARCGKPFGLKTRLGLRVCRPL